MPLYNEYDLLSGIADEKNNAILLDTAADSTTIFLPDNFQVSQSGKVENYWFTVDELKSKWQKEYQVGQMQADNLLMKIIPSTISNLAPCGFSYCRATTRMNPSGVSELLQEKLGVNIQFDPRSTGFAGQTEYAASTEHARLAMSETSGADWWIEAYWGE